MAKFDCRNGREYGLALSATLSGTTKAEGDWIDMQGFQGLTFTVSTGTVTDAGTSSGFSFQVEEDADLVGLESDLTVTSDTDDNVFVGTIGYTGEKRYVRMTAVGTTGTNAVVACHAVKEKGEAQGVATIDTGTAAT
jgi:hypothetical protein